MGVLSQRKSYLSMLSRCILEPTFASFNVKLLKLRFLDHYAFKTALKDLSVIFTIIYCTQKEYISINSNKEETNRLINRSVSSQEPSKR